MYVFIMYVAAVSPRSSPLGTFRETSPSGDERGQTSVFPGYQKGFISMITAKNSVHIPKRWTKLWQQNILLLHGIRVKEFKTTCMYVCIYYVCI